MPLYCCFTLFCTLIQTHFAIVMRILTLYVQENESTIGMMGQDVHDGAGCVR